MADPIKPVFQLWNNELGEWQWGLNPDDYMRVQSGYGCAKCLEPFEFWVAVCPVCGQPNVAEKEVPVPSFWKRQGG